MSEGVVLSQDRSSNEKIFKVTDNGTYIFRITGNNGRRIKVECIVTNAIPMKKDLLTAIADINTSGISKCRVEGRTNETAEYESVTYSLNVIVHEGDLVLDGLNDVEGAIRSSGNLYQFGNKELDIGTDNSYAKNTVVFKVVGNLTVKAGVTVTAVSGEYGGPKGMIIYCTGNLENDGDITMTYKGGKALGENIYLYKRNDDIFEFVPKIRRFRRKWFCENSSRSAIL